VGWVGNVERKQVKRIQLEKILVGKNEGKRTFGRSRHRTRRY
jgi:hypothetical protein